MRLVARLALVIVLVAAPGCRPDELDLRYRFEPQAVLTYELAAEANAFWDIGTPGSGSYRVTFRVIETILSVDEQGAVVKVTMQPEEVEEAGLPSPGSEDRTFTLRVGESGEVLDVIEVDGVPATALDHDELAFIGTYRPPLPLDPVGLHQSWNARQEVTLDVLSQQLATRGRLLGLRREDHRLAQLGFSGEGPLTWETTLPQGEARLTGQTTTGGRAELDLDEGFLRAASSTTSGDFTVRVTPSTGNVPITGTLHLDIELDLQQVSTAQ
ncbi:MAG TPA: hypothetical protein VIG64_10280 [Actinomycetota bacterium]|jgi:hypothetical protein